MLGKTLLAISESEKVIYAGVGDNIKDEEMEIELWTFFGRKYYLFVLPM